MLTHASISPQSQTTPAAVEVKAVSDVSPEQEMYKESVQFLPIQCKLSVGAPDDPLEQEADAVADKVMRMPEPFLQRKCAGCEEEEKAQRKPLVSSITPFIQTKGAEGGTASDGVSSQINATRGSGREMERSTQSFMESRFGTDFSGVRIHTGSYATEMSRELNAQAFTVGNDIYFNNGKYAPESTDGKHLLAHELTHTVQQNDNAYPAIRRRICDPLTDPADMRREFCIGINRDAGGAETFQLNSRQSRRLSLAKSSANWVLSRALLAFSARDRYITTLVDYIFGAGTMQSHTYSFFESKIVQIRDMLNSATLTGGTCYDQNCYTPGVAAHALPASNGIVLCYSFFRLCPDDMRRTLIHEAAHNIGIDAARVANFGAEYYCREDTSLCSEVCNNLPDALDNVDAWAHFIECVAFSF